MKQIIEIELGKQNHSNLFGNSDSLPSQHKQDRSDGDNLYDTENGLSKQEDV